MNGKQPWEILPEIDFPFPLGYPKEIGSKSGKKANVFLGGTNIDKECRTLRCGIPVSVT